MGLRPEWHLGSSAGGHVDPVPHGTALGFRYTIAALLHHAALVPAAKQFAEFIATEYAEELNVDHASTGSGLFPCFLPLPHPLHRVWQMAYSLVVWIAAQRQQGRLVPAIAAMLDGLSPASTDGVFGRDLLNAVLVSSSPTPPPAAATASDSSASQKIIEQKQLELKTPLIPAGSSAEDADQQAEHDENEKRTQSLCALLMNRARFLLLLAPATAPVLSSGGSGPPETKVGKRVESEPTPSDAGPKADTNALGLPAKPPTLFGRSKSAYVPGGVGSGTLRLALPELSPRRDAAGAAAGGDDGAIAAPISLQRPPSFPAIDRQGSRGPVPKPSLDLRRTASMNAAKDAVAAGRMEPALTEVL